MRTNLLNDQDARVSMDDMGASTRTHSTRRSVVNSSDTDVGFSKYFSKSHTAVLPRRSLSFLFVVLFLFTAVIIGLSIYIAIINHNNSNNSNASNTPLTPDTLPDSISVDDLFLHVNALQQIADNNGGTRVIGGTGFNATVDYVFRVLTTQATNLDVMQQFFVTSGWNMLAPTALTITSGRTTSSYAYMLDYAPFTYSGSAILQGVGIVAIADGGCTALSWVNQNVSGNVVILKRGVGCTLNAKIISAVNYSAVAILIYNDGSTIQSHGLQITRVMVGCPIPAISMTYDVGVSLYEAALAQRPGQITVGLNVSAVTANITVANTCATTRTGDVSSTIVAGSHYDSVQAGAGINDNGSGTSLNLVIALATSRLLSMSSSPPPLMNRLRFCWWAAEEVGLLGSAEYARRAVYAGLNNGTIGERIPQDIQVNLNYDIVGSPNFVFGVWDGDTFINPNRSSALIRRSMPGSLLTTRLYEEFFNKSGLTYDYRELDNRSDYASFHAVGVAAGGATSGRETIKTIEQRNRYATILGRGRGGMADVQYDQCYHMKCDMVWGIHPQAILNITRAAASVLMKLANTPNLATYLGYPPVDDTPLTQTQIRQRVEQMERNFAAVQEQWNM